MKLSNLTPSLRTTIHSSSRPAQPQSRSMINLIAVSHFNAKSIPAPKERLARSGPRTYWRVEEKPKTNLRPGCARMVIPSLRRLGAAANRVGYLVGELLCCPALSNIMQQGKIYAIGKAREAAWFFTEDFIKHGCRCLCPEYNGVHKGHGSHVYTQSG